MVLKSVTVVHGEQLQGTPLVLPLLDATLDDRYIVTNIDGLGPVDADISTEPFGPTRDGKLVQGMKVGERNVVFSIAFNPMLDPYETVTQLRREMYDVFTPKRRIRLSFSDDELSGTMVLINGRVESVDPILFTSDPTVQISILFSSDPYFRRPVVTTEGERQGTASNRFVVDTEGTESVGFRIETHFAASSTAYSLYVDETRIARLVGGFNSGDIMRFSTVPGEKGIFLSQNGSSYESVLNRFDPEVGFPDFTAVLQYDGSVVQANASEGSVISSTLVHTPLLSGL